MSQTIRVDENPITVRVLADELEVRISSPGPQGPAAPEGPVTGAALFVADTLPAGAVAPYLWVQTGLGASGNDFTLWFEEAS